MADIIDINVFETTETVAITVTPNLITVNVNQVSAIAVVKSIIKSTYALMIADGTPIFDTIYTVTNDENKSYTRSTYFWKSNGNREWIASIPDN